MGAAEGHLRRAVDAYLADGNAFNATLAALDLGEVYFEQARTAEVKVLAGTTCSALPPALDVPPEAARAARLFAKVAATERLTAALLARLRRSLEG